MAPIPCQHCSQVSFCSAVCRDESQQSYHGSECGFTDILNASNVGKHGLLAFRTLSKMANCHFESMLNNDVAVGPSCTESLYDSCSYSSVYQLITNERQRSVADLFRRTIMAVYLSSIWQSLRGGEPREEHCVAAVFLQHLQNFPCNAHGISQLCVPASGPGLGLGVSVSQAHLDEVGAAAFPCLSLINHSCDPNVVRNCYGDVAVVTVIRTVARHDQILDNYGYHYATHSSQERSQRLRNQYYFHCRCVPCVDHWPLYDQIQTHTESREVMASSSLFQGDLEQFMRLSCGADVEDLAHMSRRFSRHIAVLDRHAVKPFRQYNDAQEALKQCLALVATVYYRCQS